ELAAVVELAPLVARRAVLRALRLPIDAAGDRLAAEILRQRRRELDLPRSLVLRLRGAAAEADAEVLRLPPGVAERARRVIVAGSETAAEADRALAEAAAAAHHPVLVEVVIGAARACADVGRSALRRAVALVVGVLAVELRPPVQPPGLAQLAALRRL